MSWSMPSLCLRLNVLPVCYEWLTVTGGLWGSTFAIWWQPQRSRRANALERITS
jgi:hypothetical protein